METGSKIIIAAGSLLGVAIQPVRIIYTTFEILEVKGTSSECYLGQSILCRCISRMFRNVPVTRVRQSVGTRSASKPCGTRARGTCG